MVNPNSSSRARHCTTAWRLCGNGTVVNDWLDGNGRWQGPSPLGGTSR